MKKSLIFTVLIASFSAVVMAQQPPTTGSDAKSAAPGVSGVDQGDRAKALKELKELNDKELAELKLVDDAAKPARQKYQDQMKALQAQIRVLGEKHKTDMDAAGNQRNAVHAKYVSAKYPIMDRINPGSGARLAQYDKALLDLEAQQKNDLAAITANEKAELSKRNPDKTALVKFRADMKALVDTYKAKRKELQSLLRPTPVK
ncbi:MAG: hypothetical protein WCK75_02315 [Elusimicrobiota bacterium]